MAVFSVLVLTAPPPGQANEAAGPTIKIDGREALLRSVELFLNREPVRQVLMAFDTAQQEDAKRKYGNHLGFSGVKVVWSTSKWSDQVAALAEKLIPEATHIVIHDAARPCVPFTDIDALLEAAEKHPAVALTSPVRSPLVELDEGGGGAVAAHLASAFAQLLTPRVYSRETFLAMAASKQEVHPSKWTLLKGSPINIRIGSAADASLAKAMLGLLPKPKPKGLNNPFEEAQW